MAAAARGEGKPAYGLSPSHVFPVPAAADSSHELVVSLSVIFFLYEGGERRPFTHLTAAHKRVHKRLQSSLGDFVMTEEPTMSQEATFEFLKHAVHYGQQSPVMALGLRSGVPDKAPSVDLAACLKPRFPALAAHPGGRS